MDISARAVLRGREGLHSGQVERSLGEHAANRHRGLLPQGQSTSNSHRLSNWLNRGRCWWRL